MKKFDLRVVAFAVLLLFSMSCRKSAGGPYNMTITLNGTPVTLYDATCISGPVVGSPGVNAFRMTAATYDSSKALTIDIRLSGNMKAGTYASDGPDAVVEVNYYENLSKPGFKTFTMADVSGKPVCKYTVNIIEVAGNIIRGNFTGNYLTNVSAGNATSEVTQGDFYALRVY